MDAGGLAQMSYSEIPSSNQLGLPGAGLAARRGGGANIQRLSFDAGKTPNPQDHSVPTPRTSRSHLLAGLRTAPKSAMSSTFPSTAPPSQLQHNVSFAPSTLMEDKETYNGPKTSNFQGHEGGYDQMNHHQEQNNHKISQPHQQMYGVNEPQILAPPEIIVDEHGQNDPSYYAQLVATNMYLAEQQHRLRQQLMSVQAAAQQFEGLSMYANSPVTPRHLYQQQQQVKNMMQPIIAPVAGAQPGIYSYFNPMTGQQSYFMDQHAQNNQHTGHQATQSPSNYSPPQKPGTPQLRFSPPQVETLSFSRSNSPSNKTRSPQDHEPLPPPSAGAFRRGHRKGNSSMQIGAEGFGNFDSPRSALLLKNFPSTPLSGFGPGQGRAGEHPVRQPRGPPPLDELLCKPTTKFEGSKNFATRTRRNAVHNLVRAGMERRRGPGSAGSGSMSPASDTGGVEISVSDSDSDSSRSFSLSSRPAIRSPRTSVHGVIGSDRPSSRQKNRSMERKSVASMDSSFTTASISSEEGAVGGSFAAVFKNGAKNLEMIDIEKKPPMLILTPVEKRKSNLC